MEVRIDHLAGRMVHIGELLRKIVGVKKLMPGLEYSSRTIRASISPSCRSPRSGSLMRSTVRSRKLAGVVRQDSSQSRCDTFRLIARQEPRRWGYRSRDARCAPLPGMRRRRRGPSCGRQAARASARRTAACRFPSLACGSMASSASKGTESFRTTP